MCICRFNPNLYFPPGLFPNAVRTCTHAPNTCLHMSVGSLFTYGRATTLRLEQQLQREAQSDKAQVPRTWTKVSAVPDRCATAAAAPPAVARSSALPAGANLPESDKGRRASCPEANLPSRSSQARRSLNQLPRRRDAVTMREVLEDQQKAATIYMADTSKVRFTLFPRSPRFVEITQFITFLRAQHFPSRAPWGQHFIFI